MSALVSHAVTQVIYRTRLSVVFEGLLVLVGLAQWVFAVLHAQPLAVDTWGRAALLLPLEAWALAMTLGSLSVFLGLLYPPNVRLIRIGCFVQITHIGLLGVSAATTGGDPVVAVFAFGLLVPLHVFLALRSGHEP